MAIINDLLQEQLKDQPAPQAQGQPQAQDQPQAQQPSAQPAETPPQQGAKPQPGQPQPEQQAQSITASDKDLEADKDRFVAKGMELLHSPQNQNSIIQMLRGADKVKAVGDATKSLIQRVDSASRKQGTEVQDMVKMQAGSELLDQVTEIGEAAGVFKLTPKEKQLALSVSTQDYLNEEIAAGRIDQGKLQEETKKGMQQMTPAQLKVLDSEWKQIGQTAEEYKNKGGV